MVPPRIGGRMMKMPVPMLFNMQMAQALSAGWKTVTRRIMVEQPEIDIDIPANLVAGRWVWDAPFDDMSVLPEYTPGQLIWVRETFAFPSRFDFVSPKNVPPGTDVIYAADCPDMMLKKRPNIFMPRWASRFTLKVISARPERLQSISMTDIVKEGLVKNLYDFRPATAAFAAWEALWVQLNGRQSWDENPWLWRIEFDVIHKNIDDVEASGLCE